MSENTSLIQVYIENAAHPETGGFTIPLPTTKEKLAPWLEGIEATDERDIAIREIRSGLDDLDAALRRGDASLNELNYLAAKIQVMSLSELGLFYAALDADRHCGNVGELVNLIENIDCFDLQPAFDVMEYGRFLLEIEQDSFADIFKRLQNSSDAVDCNFATYVERLEEHVDIAAFARTIIEEEQGTFVEFGYLTESMDFKEIYHTTADIPQEYRLFPDPGLLVTKDVDLAPFLLKLFALTDCPVRDNERSMETLTALRSSEYLLLADKNGSYLTEAPHAYMNGSDAFEAWMTGSDSAQAFAIHITEVHGRATGDVVALNFMAHRYEVLNNCIRPESIDAVFKDGSEKTFTLAEWMALPQIDKDAAESWTRHFSHEELQGVIHKLEDIRDGHGQAGKPVSEETFLAKANAAYMAASENPVPDMLRVKREAAAELLARGDAEVYRLLPAGPEKLSAIDAVKSSGLWYTDHREFAIRREDLQGLDKWAQRSAEAVLNRAAERSEHKKSHGEEL